MHYSIYYRNPLQQFIDIELVLDTRHFPVTTVHLPVWRPGRYELANFVQNIQQLKAFDVKGNMLSVTKSGNASWEIASHGVDKLKIVYNYYAHHMDAGSSWIDEEQLYINFINCLLYEKSSLDAPCQVSLHLPDDFEVACGLPFEKNVLTASSYYHLVECPMIASNDLQHISILHDDCCFHLWIKGHHQIPVQKLEADFKAFIAIQTEMMGGFPCSDYHFMFQFTHNKSYHGVEHFNSTVITLGPADEVHQPDLYKELLGVSSHELFHTWNAIRIKTKEFIPYDFSRENYFETGYVAEGFTTYYGDLLLARSQVLSKAWFFEEFSKQLNRHFHNFGRFNLSIADSSYQLWIDGYQKGIPDRKVSIYTKGALIAMVFDLEIRKHSNDQYALDDVMRALFSRFGDTKSGYDHNHISQLIDQYAEASLRPLFDALVFDTDDMYPILNEALSWVGCEIVQGIPENKYELSYGFKATRSGTHFKITKIHPSGAALNHLSIDDEIIAIDGVVAEEDINALIGDKTEISLSIIRNGKENAVKLNQGQEGFTAYALQQIASSTTQQIHSFEKWLGITW